MKRRLIPCSICDRHVRVGDALCPFCAAPARVEPRAHVRLGVLAASAMVLGAACDSTIPSKADQPSEGGVVVAPPPTSNAADAASANAAPTGPSAPGDAPADAETPADVASATPSASVLPPTPTPAGTGRVSAPKYGMPPRPAAKYGMPPMP